MTAAAYTNCHTRNRRPTNASDKRFCLISARTDADSVGLASNTFVADVDIVVAGGEIVTGASAQGDVSVTSGVAIERKSTVGRVFVAGVVKERLPTGGGVYGAGCAETHCCTTGGSVAGAVRVE